MKKRNQKFNALQLNKVIISKIFGGISDTDPHSDYCDEPTDYCTGATAGSAKTASKAVTRYC